MPDKCPAELLNQQFREFLFMRPSPTWHSKWLAKGQKVGKNSSQANESQYFARHHHHTQVLGRTKTEYYKCSNKSEYTINAHFFIGGAANVNFFSVLIVWIHFLRLFPLKFVSAIQQLQLTKNDWCWNKSMQPPISWVELLNGDDHSFIMRRHKPRACVVSF